MEREKFQPENKSDWLSMRVKDITSTEVSALFGISPYLTEFELWHRKKDNVVVEIDENERMKWGTRLESAIAEGIGADQGWEVTPYKEYVRIPDIRIGSSFDYRASIGGKITLLEIKNVDSLKFKEGWIVEDEHLEAPPHIEMQVQHQMLVDGADTCHIGALVGGNRVILIKRLADQAIHKAILTKVANFWKSIDKNQPPSPDYARDAKFISSLYGYAEPGKVIEAGSEYDSIVEEYKRATDIAKEAKERCEGLKAQLLTLVGDAEKVMGDTFTISAGMVSEAHVEYTRKAYRNFRISYKKKKEK